MAEAKAEKVVKFKHPRFGTTMHGTEAERDAVINRIRPDQQGALPMEESVFTQDEPGVFDQVTGKTVTQEEYDALQEERAAEAKPKAASSKSKAASSKG